MRLFALFSFIIGARSIDVRVASTSNSLLCTTKHGSSSVAIVPSTTVTDTSYSTIHSTALSSSTVTLTPVPVTLSTTSIIYSTVTVSAPEPTDTFTSSFTATETDTEITTITSTFATTILSTTSEQGTTTVAENAGFTPIASSVPGAGMRRRDLVVEEDDTCEDINYNPEPVPYPKPSTQSEKSIETLTSSSTLSQNPSTASTFSSKTHPPNSSGLNTTSSSHSSASITSALKLSGGPTGKPSPTFNRSIYPTAVVCSSVVDVISTITVTSAAQSAATVTAIASTVDTTIFSTSTLYTTLTPVDASTTITVSTTLTTIFEVTATASTTTIVTSTSTVLLPSATTYAQCQSNNIITTVNGATIVEVDLTNGPLSSSSTSTAYACCAICSSATGCGGFAWVGGSCFILNDANGVCNGAVSSWSFEASTSSPSSSEITVGNGGCGQGTYGGT